MIKTQFAYTEDAMRAFFRFHLNKKSNVRWIYYGFSCLLIIIASIVTFVFHEYIMGLIMMIVSIVMFILYPTRADLLAKKTAQSRYKRPPQEIIFYEDRIEQNVEGDIKVYPYSQVVEVNETKCYFYFYVSKQGAVIVEKRQLKEEEYQSFIQLIQDHKMKHYCYQCK